MRSCEIPCLDGGMKQSSILTGSRGLAGSVRASCRKTPVASRLAWVWRPAFRRRNRSLGQLDLRLAACFARQRFGRLKPGLRTGPTFLRSDYFDKRAALAALPETPETRPKSVAFRPEIAALRCRTNRRNCGKRECSTAVAMQPPTGGFGSRENVRIPSQIPTYSGSGPAPAIPEITETPAKNVTFRSFIHQTLSCVPGPLVPPSNAPRKPRDSRNYRNSGCWYLANGQKATAARRKHGKFVPKVPKVGLGAAGWRRLTQWGQAISSGPPRKKRYKSFLYSSSKRRALQPALKLCVPTTDYSLRLRFEPSGVLDRTTCPGPPGMGRAMRIKLRFLFISWPAFNFQV